MLLGAQTGPMVALGQTLHGHDEGVRWEATLATAAAPLGEMVTSYGGFDETTLDPAVRRELPAASLVLLLSLAEPLSLSRSGEGSGYCRSQAALVGVSRTGVVAAHAGRQSVLEVQLSPLAARTVFGVAAAELTDQIVDLTELWADTSQLLERLRMAPDWADRFHLIEAALGERVDEGSVVDSVLAGAWQQVLDARGDVGLQVLREQTGWSRKRLAARFRAEIGLPPKAMASLTRFQHAVNLLRRPGHRSLAAVALTCGYYDQAHLNREFRELAGCTPTEFLVGQDIDVAGNSMAGY